MIGPTGVSRGRATVPGGWLVDTAAAAVLVVVSVLAGDHIHPASDGRALDALGYALVVLASASIARCRRQPRLILGIVVIVLACYVARRYPANAPVFATGWVALTVLSWRTNRRTALLGAVAMLVALGVAAAVGSQVRVLSALPLVFIGWSAAAVFLGDALRTRRSYLTSLADRRVAEERVRIARDLHDSVGHAMATINVQAAAGAHVAHRRPEAAKEALTAIQRASADLLDDLTAMLSVLREDGEQADRSPTPGIEQLPQLVDATRAAHVHACLEVAGPTETVPRSIGTAAYRIVQESLTNVIRHAGARTAQVTVHAGDDRSLTILVRDDGIGPRRDSPGGGTGIRGMRERAESTGGRLEAGPHADGGFAVHASWTGRP